MVECVAEFGLHGFGLHGDKRQMVDAVDIGVVLLEQRIRLLVEGHKARACDLLGVQHVENLLRAFVGG